MLEYEHTLSWIRSICRLWDRDCESRTANICVCVRVCVLARERLSREKEGVSRGRIWEPSQGTLNKLTKVVLFSDQAQRGEHLALLETL